VVAGEPGSEENAALEQRAAADVSSAGQFAKHAPPA